MALITSQQLTEYYNNFKSTNLTFTKDVIRATALLSKFTQLKCLGDHWPCVLYSCSMEQARIIASLTKGFHEKLRSANNMVSLHLSFSQEDKSSPLSFFINSKIIGFTPYDKNKPELNFLSLEFTQHPPDDLISIIGSILHANENSAKRKEDRIEITADNLRNLPFSAKTTLIYIDGIPRKCILRDVSYGGSKLILPGIGKFLMNKEAILRIEYGESNKKVLIPGKIIRTEGVAGRKDLTTAALAFFEEKVPYDYKLLLTEFFNANRIKGKKR